MQKAHFSGAENRQISNLQITEGKFGRNMKRKASVENSVEKVEFNIKNRLETSFSQLFQRGFQQVEKLRGDLPAV